MHLEKIRDAVVLSCEVQQDASVCAYGSVPVSGEAPVSTHNARSFGVASRAGLSAVTLHGRGGVHRAVKL